MFLPLILCAWVECSGVLKIFWILGQSWKNIHPPITLLLTVLNFFSQRILYPNLNKILMEKYINALCIYYHPLSNFYHKDCGIFPRNVSFTMPLMNVCIKNELRLNYYHGPLVDVCRNIRPKQTVKKRFGANIITHNHL